MDPYICCLLGICCPPASPEQLEAFEKGLIESNVDPEKAKKLAKQFQKDLVAFTKKLKKAVDA